MRVCTPFFYYNLIMAHIFYNSNPYKILVGDCVVRGISNLEDQSWDDTYWGLCIQGYIDKDMPSSNSVWGDYLYKKGYRQHFIPDTCPNCMTVERFCYEHPIGEYLLTTGTHVIFSKDGNYYDTWPSGDETIISYWTKGDIQ